MGTPCKRCGVGLYVGRVLAVNAGIQWCTACWADLPSVSTVTTVVRDGKLRCRYRDGNDAAADLTPAQWAETLLASAGNCAYCRAFVGRSGLTLDHLIPISKGGTHSLPNVVPACASCNFEKGGRTVEQWVSDRGRKLRTTTTKARRRTI